MPTLEEIQKENTKLNLLSRIKKGREFLSSNHKEDYSFFVLYNIPIEEPDFLKWKKWYETWENLNREYAILCIEEFGVEDCKKFIDWMDELKKKQMFKKMEWQFDDSAIQPDGKVKTLHWSVIKNCWVKRDMTEYKFFYLSSRYIFGPPIDKFTKQFIPEDIVQYKILSEIFPNSKVSS